MEQYLLITIIISLICIGANCLTWKGMILGGLMFAVVKFLVEKISRWVKDEDRAYDITYTLLSPFILCPICMASVWTMMAWFLCGYWFNPIIVAFMVCGLNTIIVSIIRNIIPEE